MDELSAALKNSSRLALSKHFYGAVSKGNSKKNERNSVIPGHSFFFLLKLVFSFLGLWMY